MFRKKFKYIIVSVILCILLIENTKTALAAVPTAQFPEGWPQGPSVEAESAIVMEAGTGAILYEKNSHEELYPASITKIMTTLLALNNSSLNESVTFSHDAVFSVGASDAKLGGIDEGDKLTMEQCLYGIMLASANDVSYAVAEHIGGSLSKFVDMMNEEAKKLGCENTHFMNASGLPDPEHYTTAYDMALISQEALKNPVFCQIAQTMVYTIPADEYCPEPRARANHHEMKSNGKYPYDGWTGGKTGWTASAGYTLVTFAHKNNMDLICVIMKSSQTGQYTDTKALLDYGFQNFKRMNLSEADTGTAEQESDDNPLGLGDFMKEQPLLGINSEDYIVIPGPAGWDQIEAEFIPEAQDDETAGSMRYTYNGYYVGTGRVVLNAENAYKFQASTNLSRKNSAQGILKINPWVIVAAAVLAVILIVVLVLIFRRPRRRRRGRKLRF
ncbi:D-alanyl-D-alanine carboxypeptidase family protein [Diplocloster modestus]|uniref:D-alanyl-D-alanine carboxypeptidase n=1 Tax=Diplocloster modestus TaxID=2850322 RepID=A0ABS6K7G6_9FIRM|nr:D-alanyl-D-alanine carboxypeptidase family protein [Diplocloster modestus]MBU9726442.1 D-alanyl-D-alanine carboxypeptidase [Diplocloster modestus]